MKVLGYNGGLDGYASRFGTCHDAAAALVVDGELVAAAEEERFNRVKHSGAFPIEAIHHCLEQGGLSGLKELDLVCFYHSQDKMWHRGMVRENGPRMRPGRRALFSTAVSGLRFTHRCLGLDDARTARTFAKRTGFSPPEGRYHVVGHHLSHAASAFYESPFQRALCLVLDGQGESTSSSAWVGGPSGLHLIDETYAPNSMGYLYQTITRYLGFEHGDEFKVMGLAPYGDPARFRRFFHHVVRPAARGRFAIDPEWLGSLVIRDALLGQGRGYPRWMVSALGPPRRRGDEIQQHHMDLAAALQEALEGAVMGWLWNLRKRTGLRKLCLAGGVALNCVLNGKIARSGLFEQVHVVPAAHDAGCAAGAALFGYYEVLGGSAPTDIRSRRARVFLGPKYGPMDIRHALRGTQFALSSTRASDWAKEVARVIADGKVVGLFHGRMEWGPRALGNRSILADPRRPEMKDIVNRSIKMREGFRPFAPAVLHEQADKWFDLAGLRGQSPHMLFAVPVRDACHARIPAVTHVDGSARVQTVQRDDNPRFHALLRAFFELTGVPVLLNTSLNVQGEPIAHTPSDAIRCFVGSGLDLLVLGDLLIQKKGVPLEAFEPIAAAAGGAAIAESA